MTSTSSSVYFCPYFPGIKRDLQMTIPLPGKSTQWFPCHVTLSVKQFPLLWDCQRVLTLGLTFSTNIPLMRDHPSYVTTSASHNGWPHKTGSTVYTSNSAAKNTRQVNQNRQSKEQHPVLTDNLASEESPRHWTPKILTSSPCQSMLNIWDYLLTVILLY